MPDYYTLWTDAGLQKIGEATGNQPFSMPTAVVGDGNGKTIIPNKGMTALVNQVWSGQVGSVFRSQKDPNTRVYEFVIPASAGPFTIREVGLKNADGNLCIVGNFPAAEKPVKTSGTTRDMVIRIPVHFENADHVTLVVDPAAGASKGYVDQKVGEHADKRNNPHGVTKTQVGLGNIPNAKSDSVTSASSDQLATSKAVKAAFDKAVAAQSTADAALPKTDQAADSARIGGVSAERVLCAGTSSWGTRAQNLDAIDKTGAYDATSADNNDITGGPVPNPWGSWLWAFKWLHGNGYDSKHGGMIATENNPKNARFWLRATDQDGTGEWTQIYTHRHKPTKVDVGLGNLPNAKSDAVSSTSSDQLATSKAVKTAFDKAVAAKNTADAALPKTDQAADSARIGGVSAERVLSAGTSSWGTRAQNLDDIDKTGAYDANDKDGNVITGGPVAKPLGRWLWAFKWLHSNKEKGKSGGMIAAENDSVGSRFWLRATDWYGRGDWTQIYTHRHKPTKVDVGLGNIPNVKSDAVSSTSSNQLATSKAVKIAFDKAVAAKNTADAALPKTGGTVSGFTRFTGGICTSNGPIYSAMQDDVNKADYIWHDEGRNRWHFCSDASSLTHADGNSTLCAGGIRFANGKAFLGASDDDGIHLQNNNGYVNISPDSAVSCRFSTDRNKFYFDKPLYAKGEIYAGSSYDNRVYHKGYKPTKADVGLGNLPNAKSDSVSSSSSDQLATSKAVKLAYDKARAALDKGDFPASKAKNGWQKLPSGLILQWGTSTLPTDAKWYVQALPTAMPTSIVLMTGSPDRVLGPKLPEAGFLFNGSSRSSFKIASWCHSGTSSSKVNYKWFVIGY